MFAAALPYSFLFFLCCALCVLRYTPVSYRLFMPPPVPRFVEKKMARLPDDESDGELPLAGPNVNTMRDCLFYAAVLNAVAIAFAIAASKCGL